MINFLSIWKCRQIWELQTFLIFVSGNNFQDFKILVYVFISGLLLRFDKKSKGEVIYHVLDSDSFL